jgi:hypothetical protein
LVVKRSTRDLLNTLATIGERGATFKSLGEVGIGPSPKSQVACRSSFIRSSFCAKTGRRLSGTKRSVKRGVGLDFADLNQLASLFFGEEFDISP